MQDLKVIGVENGALLAASDDGERFRIAIDEVLQSRLRQRKTEAAATAPKLSPREVQAHIRSGMSAEDVAAVTGASLEYIQRFEGPIVAEREHIVASALSVPVHTTADVDPLGEGATFGAVIRDRLASLGVAGERWAGWKDAETGWIVKLEFTADQIDHDARWGYDARKHALAPLNSEATTLSQQGELKGALIPRLRAVAPHSSEPDDSRFDSGAFTFHETPSDLLGPDAAPFLEPVAYSRTIPSANNSIAISAIKRSDDDQPKDVHQTADLLEALRRRRGEREAAGFDDKPEKPAAEPGIRIIDVPLDELEEINVNPVELRDPPAPEDTGPQSMAGQPSATGQQSGTGTQSNTGPQGRIGKKGRASMPSWDEIVFGARTDDDLA
ncbi:septation protein SepH [Diaminobutyricibacter sp. McL0618]|uniref:septation protein SepH n=1 Tax=Leifsonia sp. McL0618 TaxID=3415677 RepID=UPI003CF1BFD6